MNFDKETIIVITICMVLLFLWPVIFKSQLSPETKKSPTVPKETSQQEASTPSEKTAPSTEEKKQDVTKEAPAAKDTKKPEPVESPDKIKTAEALKPLEPVAIENDLMKLIIDPNYGGLVSLTLKNYKNANKTSPVVFDDNLKDAEAALALKFKGDSQLVLSDIDGVPGPDNKSYSLQRTYRTAEGTDSFVLKQYWQLEEHYQVLYTIEIQNVSTQPVSLQDLAVKVGEMQQVKDLSGDKTRREIYSLHLYLEKEKRVDLTDATDAKNKIFPYKTTDELKWISISNKYFCSILFGDPVFKGCLATKEKREHFPDDESASKEKDDDGNEYRALNASGIIGDVSIAPNQKESWKFTYYTGPKSLTLLKLLDPDATEIMRLAWWSWLEWISQMLLNALIYIKSQVGSWGWSIIILTIIIRGAFWPITQKANASMRKMSKLQPLMKEINEKYSDNPQLKNMKIMELYKEHKVNPLGGCLPILLQIPVFIALYCTLDGTVELRHTSFLWAQDLSQPDTIATIFGVAIHPLVLVWTSLLVVQQLMTPTAMEPMQQKMMMAMPLVMLFFLYSLPSGLTLYWTVSQTISIIQMVINRKFLNDDDVAPAKT